MNDDDEDRRTQIFKREQEKMQAIEKERTFLKDRSIAGPHAPRPTDDFIDRSLGKLRTEKQIETEANRRADAQMKREGGAEATKERQEKRSGQSMRDQMRAKQKDRKRRR